MEIEILKWVHETFHSIEWLNYTMKYVTYLGEFGAAVIALAVLFSIIPKTRPAGWRMVVGIALDVLLVNVLLKTIVDRPRPWTEFTEIKAFYEQFGIRLPTDSSFPSGHAAICFCGAVAIALRYKKWALPVLLLAGTVALSRIYLCVHYPSDVLAGVLIGSACGSVGHLVVSGIEKRKKPQISA